jgi:hypothetical protein
MSYAGISRDKSYNTVPICFSLPVPGSHQKFKLGKSLGMIYAQVTVKSSGQNCCHQDMVSGNGNTASNHKF